MGALRVSHGLDHLVGGRVAFHDELQKTCVAAGHMDSFNKNCAHLRAAPDTHVVGEHGRLSCAIFCVLNDAGSLSIKLLEGALLLGLDQLVLEGRVASDRAGTAGHGVLVSFHKVLFDD